MRASVVVARGFSSCGSRALECRLSSCGSRAQRLRGMWDLPGPGLEPVSPALAGGFFTPAPPGKPQDWWFLRAHFHLGAVLQLLVNFYWQHFHASCTPSWRLGLILRVEPSDWCDTEQKMDFTAPGSVLQPLPAFASPHQAEFLWFLGTKAIFSFTSMSYLCCCPCQEPVHPPWLTPILLVS